MNSRLKSLAIVGMVIVASIAIMGAALAADPTPAQAPQTSPGQDLFLKNLAARLNITVEQLRYAMSVARIDTINQLASDGKITPEQGDALLSGQGSCAAGTGGMMCMRGMGMIGGRGMMGGMMQGGMQGMMNGKCMMGGMMAQ